MKKSAQRVYDRAVESVEVMHCVRFIDGKISGGQYDKLKLGTSFDRAVNVMWQAGFDELVGLGILFSSQ